MPSRPAHNIHVIPLGLDYDRIVRGIEAYGAHKIYIIRGKPHPVEDAVEPYLAKLKKRYSKMVESERFKEIRIDIFNIGEVCSAIYKIMSDENENKLYFSVSSSTKLLSAYLMFAVWSKGEEMTYEPVIYYVDPKRYVHIEFTELASTAERLLRSLSQDSNQKKTSEEVRNFILKIKNLANDAREGLALGEADQRQVYQIPFIPVKKPSKIGIDILKLLIENSGTIHSIDQLTRAYLRKVKEKSDRQINDDYTLMNRTRSMLFIHIKKLELLKMIKTERKGRKVMLAATDLGSIFGKALKTT